MSNGFDIYEGTATESADVARITVRTATKGGLGGVDSGPLPWP